MDSYYTYIYLTDRDIELLINQRIQDETKTTKIVVKPSYQIRTIKTLIQDITKIPVADQILKMNNAAELSETPIMESENDKTLSCFDLEDNGQVLWLYDSRKKEISIFKDRLQTIYFDLEIPNWYVSALDVKRLLNKKFDYPLPMMKLTLTTDEGVDKDFDEMGVQNLQKLTENRSGLLLSLYIPIQETDGSNFSVEIDDESETVMSLKSKIENLRNIPRDGQILVFDSWMEGIERIENSQELQEYDLQNFFIKDLLLIRKPISVGVVLPPDSRTIKISAQFNAKIEIIKTKLFQLEGIPEKDQQLDFPGFMDNLKDDKTLDECNINDGSILVLKNTEKAGEIIKQEFESAQPEVEVEEEIQFASKLMPIKEFPLKEGQSMIPYKLQNTLIHQKLVPCINVRPNVYQGGLLMPLPDFRRHFYPQSSLSNKKVHQILQKKLKIVLYKGNHGHQEVLRGSGKYGYDPVPLMLVKDLLAHWDQINFMLSTYVISESDQSQIDLSIGKYVIV